MLRRCPGAFVGEESFREPSAFPKPQPFEGSCRQTPEVDTRYKIYVQESNWDEVKVDQFEEVLVIRDNRAVRRRNQGGGWERRDQAGWACSQIQHLQITQLSNISSTWKTTQFSNIFSTWKQHSFQIKHNSEIELN